MKCLATNKKHQRSVEERHWDEMWTCIKWYTAAWCIALLDGGFISRPKLRQVLRKVMQGSSAVRDGYLTYDDMIRVLREDYDFDLEIVDLTKKEEREEHVARHNEQQLRNFER